MATKKLKSHKPSDINQNQAELIQARGRAIISEIHTLINSTWNKEELPGEWKESITVPIYKVIKHTVLISEAYHFCPLHTKFYPTFFCHGSLHLQRKLLGNFSVGFGVRAKLLIIHCANVRAKLLIIHCAIVRAKLLIIHCANVRAKLLIIHCANVTAKLLIIHCANVRAKLLIIHCAIVECLTKNGNTKRQRISHL